MYGEGTGVCACLCLCKDHKIIQRCTSGYYDYRLHYTTGKLFPRGEEYFLS